jgi:hypothetical protein
MWRPFWARAVRPPAWAEAVFSGDCWRCGAPGAHRTDDECLEALRTILQLEQRLREQEGTGRALADAAAGMCGDAERQ